MDAPLHILQVTDTHLYSRREGSLLGINTLDSLRAVLALAQQEHWPPDLIITTGDLTQDGSAEGYGYFHEVFAALQRPVHCLPGNHDRAATVQQLLNRDTIHAQSQWLQGAWQFCFLDTSVPGSEAGHLAAEELQRLELQLQQHPDHHALICLHHQPIPIDSAWLDTMAVDNGAALLALIDRHPQVRGLLWGHVHQDFHQQRKGVQFIASPSTCIQFLPHSKDFAIDPIPPGYRWLQLHSDGRIETGVVRLATIPGVLDLGAQGY